jgi:PAS domain S-box-containing protein
VQALWQNEATLNAVLDALPVGVIIADPEGKLLRVNAAHNALWGVGPETLSWEQYDQWIGYWPATGERIQAHEWAMARALLKGETVTGELVECEQFGSGQRRLFLNNAAPVRNAAGEIVAGVVAELDVTDARRAEAALLRRSEQLRRLAQIAAQINTARSLAQVIRYVTEEARALIGTHQSVASLTSSENWAQAITAVSLSEKYAQWQSYEAESEGVGIYTQVCRTNQPMRLTQAELEAHPAYQGFSSQRGKHPPLRGWLAVPLVGKDGQNIGLLQLSDKYNGGDFSADDEAMLVQLAQMAAIALENQQLYAQEQAARAQAEAASRLKDEFLATVSHELRTPLTAFLGYAQMLQTRKRDESYVARTIDKMVHSAEAQAQLIEDLLDISRIVNGTLRLNPQPIELIAVIRAALDTVRPLIEAKQLDLDLVLAPEASMMRGDASRLQQVVWNLLANAAKFTPPGGQIAVRLERADDEALLTVSDKGQGISAEFLPYVFDRFRQADSTTTRAQSGLGLGLAIVRHLVELHGGSVAAQSAGEGRGASFRVCLPLARSASTPGQPQARRNLASSANDCPPELGGLRVLLVDDQPAILELIEEILAPCGAIVRQCHSAAQALQALRVWRPDVIVSDIAMPGEDGYWLMQQVRALAPEQGGTIPAVALTAYVRGDDRRQALAAGFQRHVRKPVEPQELRAVVASLSREAGQ